MGDIRALELGTQALKLRLASEGTDAGIRVGELGTHEPPPARGHLPPTYTHGRKRSYAT